MFQFYISLSQITKILTLICINHQNNCEIIIFCLMIDKKKLTKPKIKSVITYSEEKQQNIKSKQTPNKMPKSNKGIRIEISSEQIRKIKPISQNEHVVLIKNQGKQDLRRLCLTPGAFPFSSIGYLYLAFTNGVRAFGTGFLIRPSVILTAAHNLYNRSEKVNVQYVILHMAQHQNQQRKRYLTVCAYIPREYKEIQLQNDAKQYDFGILIISPVQQIKEIEEKFGVLRLNHCEIDQNSEVYVYGYPQDLCITQTYEDKAKGIQPQQKYLFGCKNKIEKVEERIIIHHVDTSAGQSGSPIFRWSSIYDCYQVIGIHTQGFGRNKGVRITKELINRIQKWILEFRKKQSNSEKVIFAGINFQDTMERLSFTQEQKLNNQINPQDYNSKGQYEQFEKLDFCKAMQAYRKALSIYQRRGEQQLWGCAVVLHNMGNVYGIQGKYANALICYKRSLVITQKYLGKVSIEYAKTLGNIGLVYFDQRNYQKASLSYQQSINILQQKCGKQHIQYHRMADNILEVQFAHNKDVREYIKKSFGCQDVDSFNQIFLTSRGMVLASFHCNHDSIAYKAYLHSLCKVHRQTGNALRDQGKLEQAIELWRQQKAAFQQMLRQKS